VAGFCTIYSLRRLFRRACWFVAKEASAELSWLSWTNMPTNSGWGWMDGLDTVFQHVEAILFTVENGVSGSLPIIPF
jgi:hypothetical protein